MKKILRAIVKFAIYAAGIVLFRVKKIGEKNIKKGEAYILCGSHSSYWDAAILVAATKRKVCFLAKKELYDNKFLYIVGRIMDAYPIKRGENDIEAMKNCLKVLKRKEILGIFPEGTRKKEGVELEAKNGAAFLALKTGTKVIPVGIQWTDKPFKRMILNYGEPLDFSRYTSKKASKEDLKEVSEEIMKNINKLTNEKV